jgi:hypothetical protein
VSGVRAWIVILSLVSAATGFAAGLLMYAALHRPLADEGPFADYERRMAERFELGPERRRLFHTLLESYNKEREEIEERYIAESMSAVEPEQRRVDAKYRYLIRNKVLPPERREEFDRLRRPIPAPLE